MKLRIAITGHRPNKLGNDYELKSPLMMLIKKEIEKELFFYRKHSEEKNDIMLITGMALGIDTLFALMAIEYNIPFIAAIPCQQQYRMWPQKARERWMEITDNSLCTKHYVSKGDYTPEKMQRRNEWMVNNCDILIAVWDGSEGGTGNCVKYAQTKEKHIIRIDPNDLRKQLT